MIFFLPQSKGSYDEYKYVVTLHFEESDPEEGTVAYFYQTNIEAKVNPNNNKFGEFLSRMLIPLFRLFNLFIFLMFFGFFADITNWKFKDVTNYE